MTPALGWWLACRLAYWHNVGRVMWGIWRLLRDPANRADLESGHQLWNINVEKSD